MRLAIAHATRYRFAAPAQHGLYQLRLTPLAASGHTIVEWVVEMENGRIEADFLDQHGNRVQLASLTSGAEAVVAQARGVVETEDRAGVVGAHDTCVPLWLFRRQTRLTTLEGREASLIAVASAENGDLARLHALSREIHARVRYDADATSVVTRAAEALRDGHGVCQDHAHVFLGAARAMGFPARYVSGYLFIPDRENQDAGHAWAEAYVDGLGWVGFDVANGISPDERYVRVATGLDYGDAAPVSGAVVGAGETRLDVEVQVQQ